MEIVLGEKFQELRNVRFNKNKYPFGANEQAHIENQVKNERSETAVQGKIIEKKLQSRPSRMKTEKQQ